MQKLNNTQNCSPSSVLTNLHLEASKPGIKFTISSINSKTLQPTPPLTAFSLNHYPMKLLPKSYLDMRTLSLPFNHTPCDYFLQFINCSEDTLPLHNLIMLKSFNQVQFIHPLAYGLQGVW